MYPFKFQDEVNTNLIREKLHFATFEPFSPTLHKKSIEVELVTPLLYYMMLSIMGTNEFIYEGRIGPSMELIMSDQDLDLGDLISL